MDRRNGDSTPQEESGDNTGAQSTRVNVSTTINTDSDRPQTTEAPQPQTQSESSLSTHTNTSPNGASRPSPARQDSGPGISQNDTTRFIDSRLVSTLNTLFRSSGTTRTPVPTSAPPPVPPVNSAETGTTGAETASTATSAAAAASAAAAVAAASSPAGLNSLIDDTTDSNNGSIVITINYIFSDENNPVNPNRTGSLVLTLPNNSNNRNPRMLDEFIRLATQIAYTAIVNGMQKEKKHLPLKTFESFPIVAHAELESTDCSICLDAFEKYKEPAPTPVSEDDDSDKPSSKRRRTDKDSNFVSTATAPDQREEASASTQSASSASNSNAKMLLKDCTIEFPHIPVKLPCKHVFGQSCLAEWLKLHLTCPLCRTPIKIEDQAEEASGSDPSGRSTTSTTAATDDSANASDILSQNNFSNTPNVRVVDRSGDEFRFLLHNATGRGLNGSDLENNTSSSSNTISGTSRNNNSTPTGASSNTTEATGNRSQSLGRQSIFNNIRDYFRASERNEPLFPTSVESRRTASGVTTTTSGESNTNVPNPSVAIPIISASSLRESTPHPSYLDAEEVLDFLNLRSLTDPVPSRDSTTTTENGDSNQDRDSNEHNNENREAND